MALANPAQGRANAAFVNDMTTLTDAVTSDTGAASQTGATRIVR